MKPPPIAEWARRIAESDRLALAKAITLVESTREEDLRTASELLRLLPEPDDFSFRLGVTGAPGAGKSTLIDAIGSELCDRDRKVAVLTIDPSSPVSGGSILGDKTRMNRLGHRPEAFIRASPSANVPGGIALATAPVIRLCEAAGYDFVMIETVGSGQGEFGVTDLADATLILIEPGGGDGIQALKKGILELADFVAITKADGDLQSSAEATFHEFERSLPAREGRVAGHLNELLLTSVKNPELVISLVDRIVDYEAAVRPNLSASRTEQARREFLAALKHLADDWILNHPDTLEAAVRFSRKDSPDGHPIAAARASLAARIDSIQEDGPGEAGGRTLEEKSIRP